ncbi:MAG: hypothetical protein Q8O40_04475 [Chloroflexota bacterium]|nr:hypothetical protein [Chloroflexota bacterium]
MNDIQEISGTVHAVLNRLLAVYRFTAGEFHVDMVPRNEMWPMDVFTLNDDDTIGPEVQHRESFGGGLTIARHEVIPPEARRILAHGAELPMSRTLFLNAQREELFENYRLAVVEAETAFETLVDEVISQHYKATETPISKIEGILGCGLENLLKDHIPKCCGEPFFNTTEHKAWKEDLYDLRNKVVHDGASADAVQARKALQAGANAVEWVTKRPHT